MTLTCSLCGNAHFREDDDGLWCVNCGSSMSGPPSDRWSPYLNPDAARELAENRAEDEAALRDMLAAERTTGYRDRSMGS